MRARIAIATSLDLMLLGATGALPAAAHDPSVTEYQNGLTMNAGPWDLVDGRDFGRRRNILVRAGHRYLASAPRRAARLRF